MNYKLTGLHSDLILAELDSFAKEIHIELTDYLLKENRYWRSKYAIITKKQQNFMGEVIPEEALVVIARKMQKNHFGYAVHVGDFYVKDIHTNVEIGGVPYNELLLLPRQ